MFADTAEAAAVVEEPASQIPSPKALLLFALPTLVLPLADPLMSVIDTICIGSYGTVVELAATGPASLLFASASQLFSAFSATALADISRALSKGDRVEASDAFARALRDAAIAGVHPCACGLSITLGPSRYPSRTASASGICPGFLLFGLLGYTARFTCHWLHIRCLWWYSMGIHWTRVQVGSCCSCSGCFTCSSSRPSTSRPRWCPLRPGTSPSAPSQPLQPPPLPSLRCALSLCIPDVLWLLDALATLNALLLATAPGWLQAAKAGGAQYPPAAFLVAPNQEQ